ncbi:MAG: FAD-dependent oxidoreductase [Candidatus Woesearchaeota archaeon]|nr:FAD-dependent oxidoreductase [Candidatus Woesearchaeota archaeon]
MGYDYDLAIIGGGSGGLVAASSTAQLGLKVLLVEKERLGGDCLWYGCVPSKALIATGKRIHQVRTTAELGLPNVTTFSPNFRNIMQRMRDVQATIQPHDSPERFRKLGADVQFGDPQFLSPHALRLGKKEYSFKYCIIATGSSPFVPEIPGCEETGYLTNLNVFNLKKLPKEFVIIGAGPIGVELAQAFARFGSNVTILARSTLMSKEEPSVVQELTSVLEAEGINILYGKTPVHICKKGAKKQITLKNKQGRKTTIVCDEILIATGRKPNVAGLALEEAGVTYTEKGVTVNAYLQTSQKHIFAVGDVIGGHLFTHMAASHASTAVRNMISPLKAKAETAVIPWVTYTDPELARVGMTATEATEQDIAHQELSFAFKDADRAITDDTRDGHIRVVVTPKGKILGATILGPQAGELLQEYVLAMKHGLSIKDIAATIHPYPTLSGASWTLAGSYYKQFLTKKTKAITKFLVRWF